MKYLVAWIIFVLMGYVFIGTAGCVARIAYLKGCTDSMLQSECDEGDDFSSDRPCEEQVKALCENLLKEKHG